MILCGLESQSLGRSALYQAASGGFVEAVRLLVNDVRVAVNSKYKLENGRTAFHLGTLSAPSDVHGHARVCAHLACAGVSFVLSVGVCGSPACMYGKPELALAMLVDTVDVDIVDDDNKTAFQYVAASAATRPDMFQALSLQPRWRAQELWIRDGSLRRQVAVLASQPQLHERGASEMPEPRPVAAAIDAMGRDRARDLVRGVGNRTWGRLAPLSPSPGADEGSREKSRQGRHSGDVGGAATRGSKGSLEPRAQSDVLERTATGTSPGPMPQRRTATRAGRPVDVDPSRHRGGGVDSDTDTQLLSAVGFKLNAVDRLASASPSRKRG